MYEAKIAGKLEKKLKDTFAEIICEAISIQASIISNREYLIA
ncbi:hypothetical protein ES703_105223 [subsurface metagenome]